MYLWRSPWPIASAPKLYSAGTVHSATVHQRHSRHSSVTAGHSTSWSRISGSSGSAVTTSMCGALPIDSPLVDNRQRVPLIAQDPVVGRLDFGRAVLVEPEARTDR